MPEARKKTPFTNHPLKICSCHWKTRLPSRQTSEVGGIELVFASRKDLRCFWLTSLPATKALHNLISFSFLSNIPSALVKHPHYLPWQLPSEIVVSLPTCFCFKLPAFLWTFRTTPSPDTSHSLAPQCLLETYSIVTQKAQGHWRKWAASTSREQIVKIFPCTIPHSSFLDSGRETCSNQNDNTRLVSIPRTRVQLHHSTLLRMLFSLLTRPQVTLIWNICWAISIPVQSTFHL